jgi:REP element-mobilizing transposase RayT
MCYCFSPLKEYYFFYDRDIALSSLMLSMLTYSSHLYIGKFFLQTYKRLHHFWSRDFYVHIKLMLMPS